MVFSISPEACNKITKKKGLRGPLSSESSPHANIFVIGPEVINNNSGRGLSLTSVPGRGYLVPPFTRRFYLGFVLLRGRGGSKINHHRAEDWP
jgi:hypothetical protein